MPLISRQSPTRRGKVRPGQNVYAASASYAHVEAAVTAAAAGDTVIVPAGSATWSSALAITKRIHLVGAGIGQTVITADIGTSANLIDYQPADAASNEWFRVSGFTFDSNNICKLLRLYRNSTTITSWVRIDHNRWIAPTTGQALIWEITGMMWGVVDHNTFDNKAHIDNMGLEAAMWTAHSFTPGTINNLYYEDNTFNLTYTADSGGQGGRYCKRYNTYTMGATAFPLWDAHGNQTSAITATQGIEIYGNLVNSTYNIGKVVDLRGGKGCVFFNKIVGNVDASLVVREEYDDSISPPATAPDGTPQHVNHAYFWNNRKGASGATLFHAAIESDLDPAVLHENAEFFNHATSFDGSAGIGCGTLAARPESASTIGVGYWATDQDCTAVSDDHVGADVTTPLAGTLYRWTGSAWEAYFTPYTYPHPFTSGA